MSYDSSVLDRYQWWASLKHGGLLIAPARLAEFFPEGLDPLPRHLADRLRRDVTRVRDGDRESLGALLNTVLEEVLALDPAWWLKGPVVGGRWSQKAVTGEVIKPQRVWQNGAGVTLPVFNANTMPGGAAARLGVGRGRRAVSRVIEWLRKADHKIALLTNGRQWRLIHAGADYDAWCEWDIDFWFEEGRPGPQVEALRILLGRSALGVPARAEDERTKTGETQAPLLAAIQASRLGQAELSSVLGERVRQAVELLIHESAQAISRLDETGSVSRQDMYIAATRIVMRCVVILFAEARDLLPRDNPIYHSSYGIQGLREQLDRLAGGRPQERLRHSYSAWPRLLGLFRLVYNGSAHESLPVPRYGGGLFAPGDPNAKDPVQRALTAFERLDPCPSDAAVYRLLVLLTRSQVKVRQGGRGMWVEAPVDFSDLSSEYIGILYEGLLEFELRRAEPDEPMLFLNLGDQPALPLSRLEAMDDTTLAALVEKLGKPTSTVAPVEDEGEGEDEEETDESDELEAEAGELEAEEADDGAPPAEEEAEESDDLTRQVYQRAHAWATRAVITGKLVQKPRIRSAQAQNEYQQAVGQAASRLIARLILPGHWFLVRWGGTRKGSGTFYTRPQLAVPTTRRTLHPLVYDQLSPSPQPSPSEGEGDSLAPSPSQGEGWGGGTPKRPEEILSLKICDPAMGSGSFLIAALRYLTQAMYESLHYHGYIQAHGEKALCRLPDGVDTNSTLEETLPLPPDHPDFEAYLKARLKRHVVERCLYGVDINPLAVELARLSLWVETMDRELPFEFLDHKLKCGNALVGCWFDRFQDFPVMAWEREGGDKNHTRFVHHYREVADKKGKIRRRGDVWTQAIKDFRNDVVKPGMVAWLQTSAGQTDFNEQLGDKSAEAVHDESLNALADIHRVPVVTPEHKAELYRRRVLDDAAYSRLKEAFDTWCAVWFWPGDRLDLVPRPRDFYQPDPEAREIIAGLVEEHRFFHWELEYPDVFSAENAGFHAIIGNPPWETLQPNSQEFFSNVDPLYRTYGKQEALSRQKTYFEADPAIERDWLAYNAYYKAIANWSKQAFSPFGDEEEGGERFSFTRSRTENQNLHSFWRRRRQRYLGYADTRHPFRHQGEGKVFTYKLFLELAHTLLHPDGRLGLIVPSGAYTDKGTADLRVLFLNDCRWELLFGLINWNKIFGAIYYRFKFCIVIIQKGGNTYQIQTAFSRYHIHEWEEAEKYIIPYPTKRITQFSPNTWAILETRTSNDLTILTRIYSNSVTLGDDGSDGWRVQYQQGDFNMTSDSKLFPPRPKWGVEGYYPDEYGHWLKGNWRSYNGHMSIVDRPTALVLSQDKTAAIYVHEVEDIALPLYEGRMVGQFDFSEKGWISGKGRTATWREIPFTDKTIAPQFCMSLDDYASAAVDRDGNPKSVRGLKIGFMDVASATNSRTMIATLIVDAPCGNKVPILQTHADNGHVSQLTLCAILNSFAYDYQLRNRFGGLSLNYFILEETGLLRPNLILPNIAAWIDNCVLRLVGVNVLFAQVWQKLKPRFDATPWQALWAITPHERLRLRCMLDAVTAKLYGLGLDDVTWIFHDCDHSVEQMRYKAFYRTLDPKGFWRVDKEKDPELRHTILALVAFHDLKKKGLDAFLAQNNGEGWMLPETLRLADYGLGHDQRARQPQPVAERLGPRFLPWQLEKTPEESWAECERHAENLRLLLGGGSPASEASEAPGPDAPTDLFGEPVQRDLFGNVVYPRGKRKQ